MTVTLAQLLTPQTQAQLFQIGLGIYQANGFPVNSWQTGGTERTRLMAYTAALADVVGNYIPAAAGGNFLDYATTLWLRLTAQERFNILYNLAGFTQGGIVATVASGSGPYSYTQGSLVAIFSASGNRYLVQGSGTIAAGPGSTSLVFKAEKAGASYNDLSNAAAGTLTLVTPLPGVTLSNPAGTYTAVAPVGSGTGTLTLTGAPALPHQVTVRIDTTGASGVAAWSYSLDGAPFVSFGAFSGVTNLSGTGINITLVNGGSGTSFVLGDTYTFATPGSWITSPGNDDESDFALANRCRNRWSSLSPIPTNSFYQLLAMSTPGVGSQVTQAIPIPDSVINNKVNIIVAGPGGALPPATIATIQAYVNARVPITDLPLVLSPSILSITLAGIVTCHAPQLSAAQGAIQTALTNYIAAVGINGTIRLSSIIELIMQVAGVVDVSGVTINGSAANLPLGSTTTFVLPSLLPLALGYVTVA